MLYISVTPPPRVPPALGERRETLNEKELHVMRTKTTLACLLSSVAHQNARVAVKAATHAEKFVSCSEEEEKRAQVLRDLRRIEDKLQDLDAAVAGVLMDPVYAEQDVTVIISAFAESIVTPLAQRAEEIYMTVKSNKDMDQVLHRIHKLRTGLDPKAETEEETAENAEA